MAITSAEMVAGVTAAFADAATWARAMTRLALVEKIREAEAVIAQGQATIGKRDVAEQAWLEAERAKLATLNAQLTALGARPTVPVEPGP